MALNWAWCLFAVGLFGSIRGDLQWWQSDIIYQIYPLSFKDSDGDGYGDLNGITEKLQYLKEMGVGAICLQYILKAPYVDMDSEVMDFTDVDPRLGTLEDFDRLINSSNDLGLKVILEFIPNHSSDQHPWFRKSVLGEDPYKDYYVWADGKHPRQKRAVPVYNSTENPTQTTVIQNSSFPTPVPDSRSSTKANEDNSVRRSFSSTLTPMMSSHTTVSPKNISPIANTSHNIDTTKNGEHSTVSLRNTSPIAHTSHNTDTTKNDGHTTTTTETTMKNTTAVTGYPPSASNSVTKTTTQETTTLTAASVINRTSAAMNNTHKSVTPIPRVNSTKAVNPNVPSKGTILPSRKEPSSPPNNWVSNTGGSAWQWHEQRRQYYLHQSTASRPDLNYRCPQLVQEMKEVLTFWLDRGVHGFRLTGVPLLFEDQSLRDEPPGDDSLSKEIPYNLTGYWNLIHTHTMDQPETFDMVTQWRQLMDDYNANKTDDINRVLIIDGQVTTKDLLLYYGNSTAPGAHLVVSCNFVCEHQVRNAAFVDLLIRWWLDSTPAVNQIAWMTGNQNVARVADHFSSELVDIMNTLLLLLPGVPFTYYGEEIGMRDTVISWDQTRDLKGYLVSPNNYHYFSRDPARTPFQWNSSTSAGFSTNGTTWLPVNENYKDLNQNTQSQVNNSHFKVYRALAKLRKRHVIQHGEFYSHVFSEYVFGFSRVLHEHPAVVAVINLGSYEKRVNLLQMKGTQKEMCLYTSSISADFPEPDHVRVESIVLPPMSTVVLTEECMDVSMTDAALVSALPSGLLLLLCTLGVISFIF
ncbi:probable maltase [Anabrus simplex]|uniref:probable maltase n=1 Tax=Anabrus simplex TaxID=316456 RepID=UPI0035A3CED2